MEQALSQVAVGTIQNQEPVLLLHELHMCGKGEKDYKVLP
jgi:hypothetical protein